MQTYPATAIIHQQGSLKYLSHTLPFEEAYIKVRDKEKRIFTIEQIRQLPNVPPQHSYYKEWQMRAITAQRFINYLKPQKEGALLDLGAGNGWFSYQIAHQCPSIQATGIDINETELLQATQAFDLTNLEFVYGNIFDTPFYNSHFQYISINSVIQYFPDFDLLLQRLFELLSPTGEIHILDSPFYQTSKIAAAKARSKAYYTQMGVPEMAANYFHLDWKILHPYSFEILYQPNSMLKKIASKLGKIDSPFPWIKIKK